jgi:hypothetical protein
MFFDDELASRWLTPNALFNLPLWLLRRQCRGDVRVAAVRRSAWLGAIGEGHEARAKRDLPLSNVRDDCVEVKSELLGEFPTSAMNRCDDWVFPHCSILP